MTPIFRSIQGTDFHSYIPEKMILFLVLKLIFDTTYANMTIYAQLEDLTAEFWRFKSSAPIVKYLSAYFNTRTAHLLLILYYNQQMHNFDVHVTMHCDKFLIIKPTRCTNFSNSFGRNSICFRQFLCPSSGVFHCTHSNGICQQNLYDIYQCCVYSEKLLMMDRVTVRNM